MRYHCFQMSFVYSFFFFQDGNYWIAFPRKEMLLIEEERFKKFYIYFVFSLRNFSKVLDNFKIILDHVI